MLLIVRRIGKRYYFKIIINWSNRKGLSTFSIWSSNLQHPERPDTGLRMFLSLRQLDPSPTSHLYLEDWVLASMCSPPRPAQNWYILSNHKVLITYTWVILHIPSQLLSAHRQSQAAQQSHHRRLWTIDGSRVPAFSLNSPCRACQLSPYRPVTCLANLPAPSDICGSGPGAAIFRAWVTVTAGGGEWRRASTGRRRVLREPGRYDGSGNDCERGTTCTQSWELESNLSVHSVNPGEQGAGWHLYIRSEHNMSRNDPEITWVKMCRTSQFMNWRHETESQDLWFHCHDPYWEWDRSPWL